MQKFRWMMILWILIITGCSRMPQAGAISTEAVQAMPQVQTTTPAEENPPATEAAESPEAEQSKDPEQDIDLSLKPNEAGKIMVLMYHNIGSEEKEWVRTPQNFLKDLTALYEKGYRPISLTDYVTGQISTEQGKTPVVITFDDGNLNNFEYLADGTIRRDSAVGILLDFHASHPDFPLEATFFLDGSRPFRQKDVIGQKLDFLIEQGMDVGNHTKTHENLKNLTGAGIQEQIGAQAQFLEGLIRKDGYRVNTLALPFGARPKEQNMQTFLFSGSYKDIPYENIAVLNVGWLPGYSPYDSRFDWRSIPRVRASEMNVGQFGIYSYLDYFEKNPQERFISDGVADIMTVPEDRKALIHLNSERELFVYPTAPETD